MQSAIEECRRQGHAAYNQEGDDLAPLEFSMRGPMVMVWPAGGASHLSQYGTGVRRDAGDEQSLLQFISRELAQLPFTVTDRRTGAVSQACCFGGAAHGDDAPLLFSLLGTNVVADLYELETQYDVIPAEPILINYAAVPEMELSRFWGIVDGFNSPDALTPEQCEMCLRGTLSKIEMASFCNAHGRMERELEAKIWAIAPEVASSGYISDDTILDCQQSIMRAGKSVYERLMASPDKLSEYLRSQEFSSGLSLPRMSQSSTYPHATFDRFLTLSELVDGLRHRAIESLYEMSQIDFDDVTPARARVLRPQLEELHWRLTALVEGDFRKGYEGFDHGAYRRLALKEGPSYGPVNVLIESMAVDGLDWRTVEWNAENNKEKVLGPGF
jgi:hypothetical protein